MEWKLAEAKNKFSEVVRRALAEGPQRIRRRADTVYVLSEKEYRGLVGNGEDFKSFLNRREPMFDGLALERDSSEMREFDL